MSSNQFAHLANLNESQSLAPTSSRPPLPGSGASASQSTISAATGAKPRKRKGHRGGKKKRSRRKSFAALDDDGHDEEQQASGEGFYKMQSANLSSTSIDSEALLDHR